MWTATTRARSRTTWTIGRSRAMCATRHLRRTASRGTRKQHFAERLNLPAPSLSGPVTSGEGRLQVHFAQWGESVGGTKSHPTRPYARETPLRARARGGEREASPGGGLTLATPTHSHADGAYKVASHARVRSQDPPAP